VGPFISWEARKTFEQEGNTVPVSEHVRYHESAHAVAAERLGVGLEEEAMVLNSDTDARVNVKNEPCGGEDIHDWTIRRLAVKLAGPIARIFQTGEALEWNTLMYSGEYHTDFETAKTCCFRYLNIPETHAQNPDVDAMMNEAMRVAIECVRSHKASIAALKEATANRSSFSRAEVVEVIGQACP
jgi:hypothetical protein